MKVTNKEIKQHYLKIKYSTYFFYFSGIFTLPLLPILPAILLSLGIFGRWTMLGHHICHGAYDKIITNNSKIYGKLFYRRVIDWFDWWTVPLWNFEHNHLHHYNLNTEYDPDLIEKNLKFLRNIKLPNIIKRLVVLFLMCTWKWFYYAPNMYKQYTVENTSKPTIIIDYITNFKFITNILLPYFIYMFLIIPFTISYIYNKSIYLTYCNIILAEILTNIHSFIVIAPNHCGEDVYRFKNKVEYKSPEFYLRQIIGSVNYTTGSDINDYLHGYLNYQIEHHLYPNLSLLEYKHLQPIIKEKCLINNIPYIQENVFIRLCKTIDIMIGKTSMKTI